MQQVEVTERDGPVILSFPHTGLFVPDEIAAAFSDRGTALADTDWHVDRLYGGLLPSATTVRATFHRYVIDANRDPTGTSLYPGQNTTGLCPATDFDGAPLYRDDLEPDGEEVARRIDTYHTPYHRVLATQIDRVRARHGHVVLYDCHSIRSHAPFLFEGRLPDFNIGTDGGTTCAPEIERSVREICETADGFSTVVNGRFRGGWTTRHYGAPDKGVHAIQMELAQSTYMSEEAPPWLYDEARADRTRAVLGRILHALETIH